MAHDFVLLGYIQDETAARKAADRAIDALIRDGVGGKAYATSVNYADVPNGDLTTIATLGSTSAPLPSGRYLVIAKGEVDNQKHNTYWGCSLEFDTGTGTFTVIDQTNLHTESLGANATNSRATIALEAVVTLANPGQMIVQCHSGDPGSAVHDTTLVALQVI
jgi:hypothetical protein